MSTADIATVSSTSASDRPLTGHIASPYSYVKQVIDGHLVIQRFTTARGAQWDLAYATSAQDRSPLANQYDPNANPLAARYHDRCSCCYLGLTHTTDLHNRELTGPA